MNRENELYTNTNVLEYLSIIGKLESLWIIVVSGLFFSIEKKWDSYATNPLFCQLLISPTYVYLWSLENDIKQYNTKCDTIESHG